MSKTWPNREQVLEMSNSFMGSCVIGAAAELDLFTALAGEPATAEALAEKLGTDRRATPMILDALGALRLLAKKDGVYSVPTELVPFLTEGTPQTALPMIRHRMNCLRSWSQLAWVTKAGFPGPRQASIRGPEADRASFVAAMHTVSGPLADELVARLGPPQFEHLLDVGGASGTWTGAFLRAVAGSRATLFDLPDALEQARVRFSGTDLVDRVTLAGGDFYIDALPGGVDYAWVSAIVHQHSRRHNVELFRKVHAALVPGGRIAVRDVVMEPERTEPVEGALFAINMLVHTETGTTFTFDELAEDLREAGFADPALAIKGGGMSSVVVASRH